MAEDEFYLGGVSSSKMIKVPGSGKEILSSVISGYGIYATNKRIIGTKSTKLGLTRFIPLGSLATIRSDESKNFEELDRSKDFEIYKNDISRIELTPREFMKTDAGIAIYNNRSEVVLRVALANDKDFENVQQLMNTFQAERTRMQNSGMKDSERHSTNQMTYSQNSNIQPTAKTERTPGSLLLSLGSLIVGLIIMFILLSFVTSHSGLTENSWMGFLGGMIMGLGLTIYGGLGLLGH